MALIGNVSLENNFKELSSLDNAYIKVMYVRCDKQVGKANVCIFKSQGDSPLHTKDYTFQVDLSGVNFISQAYNHLKTLPEFVRTTDA